MSLARVATIPDHDHILRYCRPRQMENGTVTMSAFLLRPGEEFLSVNWLEFFGGDIATDVQVERVREDTSKSLKLSANGRFAKINVGEVKGCIDDAGVKHRPEIENPSHAGIYIPEDGRRKAAYALANMVASGVVFPGKV